MDSEFWPKEKLNLRNAIGMLATEDRAALLTKANQNMIICHTKENNCCVVTRTLI